MGWELGLGDAIEGVLDKCLDLFFRKEISRKRSQERDLPLVIVLAIAACSSLVGL